MSLGAKWLIAIIFLLGWLPDVTAEKDSEHAQRQL